MRRPLALALVIVTVTALAVAAPAAAEVAQSNGVQVVWGGDFSPRRLPRVGQAPIAVKLSARFDPVRGAAAPQLRRIAIGINRHGRIDATGLPVCRVGDIQPSTSAKAMQACRRALVGTGRFSARVLLPEQAPFPSTGKIIAFNGVHEGEPAILAHVYGTSPAPTSFTLPFVIRRSKGRFGTTIVARLPQATGDWGYVTGLELSLGRRYRWRGRTRSLLSAGCPAPQGFPGALFPFAKADFGFKGFTLGSVVTRSCRARG